MPKRSMVEVYKEIQRRKKKPSPKKSVAPGNKKSVTATSAEAHDDSKARGDEYEAMKNYRSMFGGPVRKKKRTKGQRHENGVKAERDYGAMMAQANAKGAKKG